MSLNPSMTLHLEMRPFVATVDPLSTACALSIGEAGHVLSNLTLFFPLDKMEEVQRIADALNEISKPVAASNPLAA